MKIHGITLSFHSDRTSITFQSFVPLCAVCDTNFRPFIVFQLENHDLVLFMYDGTGDIERPLRTDIPISSQRESVDEDTALGKAAKVHKAILSRMGTERTFQERRTSLCSPPKGIFCKLSIGSSHVSYPIRSWRLR